nr:hypothetical protein CFP56_09347 [Quercus suber]
MWGAGEGGGAVAWVPKAARIVDTEEIIVPGEHHFILSHPQGILLRAFQARIQPHSHYRNRGPDCSTVRITRAYQSRGHRTIAARPSLTLSNGNEQYLAFPDSLFQIPAWECIPLSSHIPPMSSRLLFCSVLSSCFTVAGRMPTAPLNTPTSTT